MSAPPSPSKHLLTGAHLCSLVFTCALFLIIGQTSPIKCLLPEVCDDSGLTEHWKYLKVWVSRDHTYRDNCPGDAASDEDGPLCII